MSQNILNQFGRNDRATFSMFTLLQPVVAAVALGLLCTLQPQQLQAQDASTSAAARDVLRRHCVRCHSGEGSEGGDFDVMDVLSLKEDDLIDTSNADESYLLSRIVDGDMPPASIRKRQPVEDSEIETLRKWITDGADDFQGEAARERVEVAGVLDAVISDLRKTPHDQRQYLRYFTLHQLHNTPGILSRDLTLYRAGLSKALNSLSWHPRIILPREVKVSGSDDGLLYAVDIRRLKWNDEIWNRIERAYPYGVSFVGSDDEVMQQRADELEHLTSVSIPIVRADWFVATATRGNLYYQILDLPQNEKQLLTQMDVDVDAAFDKPHSDVIARAGFSRSGVSAQNRLVERLVGSTGIYWRSFDFGPDAGRGNLNRFPLGPVSEKSKFNRFAFVHDGGEIIFALPNGLHAYLLVDGKGDRITLGPIQVVADALRTSGTPLIANAVSCFACHKHGMIDVNDTMRNGSVVEGEALRHLRKLHPERAVMDELVQSDRSEYLVSLKKAIGPFVLGENQDSIEQVDEPIGQVARQHRLVFLNLDTIAAELDVTPEKLVELAGSRNLRRLGLEGLTRDGLISRSEWEATDKGVSLMQQLARLIRLTPITPL